MGTRKNHILDALSEVHEVVECLTGDVEQALFDHDDGESHSKREAGVVVREHIEQLKGQLEELKIRLSNKYR